MKPILSIVVLNILFLACHKNDSEIQPLKNGAIKGTLSQPREVVKITITSSSPDTIITIDNPIDDNLLITNLPIGVYTISITPQPGFSTPAGVEVTVKGGETADVGTFILTPDEDFESYLQFTLFANGSNNSFNYSPPVVLCTYLKDTLFISTTKPATTPSQYFEFKIADVKGTGTYNFNILNPNSYIEDHEIYSATTGSLYTTQEYNPDFPSQSGKATITISLLDTTNHIVAGTFSALLEGVGFGNGLIENMMDGVFQLRY